jgi:hypothetical protein
VAVQPPGAARRTPDVPTDRLQGAVLLAGAALLLLLDPELHWVPLLLGLPYLAAAALGGPRGSYWSTAIVLTAWGIGPVVFFEAEWREVSQAALYLVCVGAGGLVAALLAERAGFAITAVAISATVLGAGLVYALQPHVEAVEEPVTYGIALAAVGALRLALGQRVAQP